jgi:hypothetical protein
MVSADPIKCLFIRYQVAELMLRYYSQGEELTDLESDRDVIRPVGYEPPEGLPARALLPITPVQFWSAELTYAFEQIQKVLVQPLQLPAQTEGVVLLPAEVIPTPAVAV